MDPSWYGLVGAGAYVVVCSLLVVVGMEDYPWYGLVGMDRIKAIKLNHKHKKKHYTIIRIVCFSHIYILHILSIIYIRIIKYFRSAFSEYNNTPDINKNRNIIFK